MKSFITKIIWIDASEISRAQIEQQITNGASPQ